MIIRKGPTAGFPSDVENRQCGNKTMLTVDIYNKVGVVAKSMIELPAGDE